MSDETADSLYRGLHADRFSHPLPEDPVWSSAPMVERKKAWARWELANEQPPVEAAVLYGALESSAFFLYDDLRDDPLWNQNSPADRERAYKLWELRHLASPSAMVQAIESALTASFAGKEFCDEDPEQQLSTCDLIEPSLSRDFLVRAVSGPDISTLGETETYTVNLVHIEPDGETSPALLSSAEKQQIQWAVFVRGQRIDLEERGPELRLSLREPFYGQTIDGHTISVRPYVNSPVERVSVATQIGEISSDVGYFVVHSTVGNTSDATMNGWKSAGVRYQGHKYVRHDGSVFQIWPLTDANVRATKMETTNPSTLGQMVHIELIYEGGGSPTEEQYEGLADLYLEAESLFGKWLTIVAHKEVDRGIPGGHSDPENFDFNKFYELLRDKNVPIDTVPKITQERFEHANYASHQSTWPPVLSGEPTVGDDPW